MSTRKQATLQEVVVSTIGGDRRREQRFAVDLPLHYSVVRNGLLVSGGIGIAVDLSSNGMAFLPGEVLPAGASVEVSMEWPCAAADRPLELVVTGRVVRSDSRLTAIGYARHEFRPLEQSVLALAAS